MCRSLNHRLLGIIAIMELLKTEMLQAAGKQLKEQENSMPSSNNEAPIVHDGMLRNIQLVLLPKTACPRRNVLDASVATACQFVHGATFADQALARSS